MRPGSILTASSAANRALKKCYLCPRTPVTHVSGLYRERVRVRDLSARQSLPPIVVANHNVCSKRDFALSFAPSPPTPLPGEKESRHSRPARHFARLRVYAHDFAFFNKKRHPHSEAGLKRCLLAGSTGGRVAAHAQFGRRHREFNVLREL